MGRSFHIGDVVPRNNVISAPMAGVTDIAFRCIAARMGAGLTVTEMATSRGLIQRQKRTKDIIRSHPEARPYSAQIFGDDPGILSRAARIVQDSGADIVDLNAACPVKKVVKAGAGSDLLRDIPRLSKILAAMRKSLDVPFTLKIRSGWDSNSVVAVQVAEVARDEGIDAITLHPRTASQGFGGKANWSLIGEVVSEAGIPVIASGDIQTPDDAIEVRRITGCQAVMVGRAAMGNPFIFSKIAAALDGSQMPEDPGPLEICRIALDHFDMMLEYHERKTAVALWRKHLCWYTRGMPYAAVIRSKIFSVWDVDELRQMAEKFFHAKYDSEIADGSATS